MGWEGVEAKLKGVVRRKAAPPFHMERGLSCALFALFFCVAAAENSGVRACVRGTGAQLFLPAGLRHTLRLRARAHG